jgi:bacillithiol biosynthesis deacetylase BshB1
VSYDVAVFGAHPDDGEMGMGGTIAKLVQAQRRVIIVSMTRGERATYGTPERRQAEAERAAKTLGCDHRILDFPDSRLVADVAARERILRLLRELRPALVFAPYYSNSLGHHDGAAHVDHQATGGIVRDAVRLARMRGVEPDTPAHDVQRLLFYMVPRNRFPTLVVDVSEQFDLLVEAIRAYESQMAIVRQGNDILEILASYRRWYGVTAGCEYAEPFVCEDVLTPDVETLFRL